MSSLSQRQHITALIAEAQAAGARQRRACAVVGITARTLQRWRRTPGRGDRRPERVQCPHNRLTSAERAHILEVLNGSAYRDLPPAQIVPRLADRGIYLASESTLHRVLRAAGQAAPRTGARRHPVAKPAPLAATAPGALYSWDITYLPMAVRGRFYYLYLFLDVFSRRIVGWQVFEREDSVHASALFADICERERIAPGQLVLHSDNGAPMKGATMLAKLQELGVAASFSRPAVSDDNPYSESLFGTMKGRSRYPLEPFDSLQAARQWVSKFVAWYNGEHRHSAIGFVTPDERHSGADIDLLQKRHALYEAARAKHPERWSGVTRNWRRVQVVHLNPAKERNDKTASAATPAAATTGTSGGLERTARA